MAVGRAERREDRRPRLSAVFEPSEVETALDLLELAEMAWHDCYSEITPPDVVVDDIVVVSEGTLPGLIRAAKLAVIDLRDLRVVADDIRSRR